MNQVRNRKVHEHGTQQTEEGETHAKAFVLLLQEFVTDKQNGKQNHQQERSERTATLEVANHQSAE